MDYWSPKNFELLNVKNKINHQIFFSLLDYGCIARWYTVHTTSNSILHSHAASTKLVSEIAGSGFNNWVKFLVHSFNVNTSRISRSGYRVCKLNWHRGSVISAGIKKLNILGDNRCHYTHCRLPLYSSLMLDASNACHFSWKWASYSSQDEVLDEISEGILEVLRIIGSD